MFYQNSNSSFQVGHREVDDPLSAWVDLKRRHYDVRLVVHQLGHEAVPFAVHHAAPLTVPDLKT